MLSTFVRHTEPLQSRTPSRKPADRTSRPRFATQVSQKFLLRARKAASTGRIPNTNAAVRADAVQRQSEAEVQAQISAESRRSEKRQSDRMDSNLRAVKSGPLGKLLPSNLGQPRRDIVASLRRNNLNVSMPMRIQHILERFLHHRTKSARSIFKDTSRTARAKATTMSGISTIVVPPGYRLCVIANTDCGLTPGWYTMCPNDGTPTSLVDCWSTPGCPVYSNAYTDPYYTVNPSTHRAYGFKAGTVYSTDWKPLLGPADPLRNSCVVPPSTYAARQIATTGVAAYHTLMPTTWGADAPYGRPTTGSIDIDVKCVSLGSATVYCMGSDTNPQYFGTALPNSGTSASDTLGASYAPMSNSVLYPPSTDIMDLQFGIPAKGIAKQVIGDADPLKVSMRVTDSRFNDSVRVGNSGFYPMFVNDGGTADWFLNASSATSVSAGFKSYATWSDQVVDGTVTPSVQNRSPPVFVPQVGGTLDAAYPAYTPPLYGGALGAARFPDFDNCGPIADPLSTELVYGPFQNAIAKSVWATATQGITVVDNAPTSGYPVYVTLSFCHAMDVGVKPTDPQFAITDPVPSYTSPFPPNFSGFLGVGGAGEYQQSMAKSIMATGQLIGMPPNVLQAVARMELATQMVPQQFASIAQHILPQVASAFNADALSPAKDLLNSAKESLSGIAGNVIENVKKDPGKALDVVSRILGKISGSGVEEDTGDIISDAFSFL